MSAQTIIHPTIDSLKKEAEDSFIDNATKYLLQRRFHLGDGYCSMDQIDARMMFDIIERNNCDIIQLIKEDLEKIEEDLPEYQKCSDQIALTANQNLYELWLCRGNIGTYDDFLKTIFSNI